MQTQSSENIDLNFVTEEKTLEAKFSTLNIWRKIYLGLLWAATALITLLLVFVVLVNKDHVVGIFSIILVGFLLVMSSWTHWAVTRRDIDHITALAVINLFPCMNILGCLIMVSIRRVTVKERNNYKII
jgi:archaellum biogenesis protein FlaJ (TadC family)